MRQVWTSFVVIFLAVGLANGQEWIGKRYILDTIVPIRFGTAPMSMDMTKCIIHNDRFYFIEQQSFQNKGNSQNAVIYSISLKDFSQSEIQVPNPYSGRKVSGKQTELWIYDFCFSGEYLLVTTQECLLSYAKVNDSCYEYKSTIGDHKNLCMGYINDGKVHYFEEDHDRGFRWFQRDLDGGAEEFVMDLDYEAAFAAQIRPNRHLFHNEKNVYYLSTRYPVLEVFTLDGKHERTYVFDLPDWNAFSDELIHNALSVPYGVERIYAVKDELQKYSCPKVVFPMLDDNVLFYSKFDSLIGKSVLQYAISNDENKIKHYNRFNHKDSLYIAAQFPFDLFQVTYDKGHASDDERIVQITQCPEVSWEGKIHSEYLRDLNTYYEDNEPTLAYKIMKYVSEEEKNSSKKDLLKDGVYVIHGEMECSGCNKAINRLLGSLNGDFKIIHVYPTPVSGLQRKETEAEIRKDCNRSFNIKGYADIEGIDKYTAGLGEQDHPCIVIKAPRTKEKVYKVSEIFNDDDKRILFKSEFVDELKLFLVNSQ